MVTEGASCDELREELENVLADRRIPSLLIPKDKLLRFIAGRRQRLTDAPRQD
jgi:hypothetical protein